MSESQQGEHAQADNQHKQSALVLGGLALVVALGVGGYVVWQSKTLHQRISHSQQAMSKSLAAAQTKWQTSLSLQQATIDKQSEAQARTSQNLQAVLKLTGRSKEDITLFAIAERLQTANLQLRFTRNVSGALALLQVSDEQLAALDDPGLQPLRHAIAKDILALTAVPTVDVAGLQAKLIAVSDSLASLSLIKHPAVNGKRLSQPKVNPTSQWRAKLNKALASLEKVVVIRHHKAPLAPLMSEQQVALAKEMLQLQLQQAQWAAIKANASVYQQSLQQVSDELTKLFAQDRGSDALIKSIQALQKIDVAPHVPNLNHTQKVMNKLLQRELKVNRALPPLMPGIKLPKG